MVPEGWARYVLGDCVEVLDSQRKPLNADERRFMKGEIPYWGANNIVDHINAFIFDEPLILMAEDGGNFHEAAERPICNLVEGKCWVNNHAHVLRSKQGFSREYIFHYFAHRNITPYINGGTRTKLNQGDLVQLPMVAPPLDEQHRIAAVLAAVDQAIQAAQAVAEQTSTLYDELRLCLPHQTTASPRNLGELVLIAWGNTSITKASYVATGARAYSATGNDGCVSNAEHHGPGIVLSAIGARCGKCFWADGDWTAIKNTITITDPKPDLNLRYLYHLANSPAFWPTGGGAQPFISQGDARALTVQIPTRLDQDRIAAMLDALESTMLLERQQVESIKTMKRGLLDDLLTGRVRVPATSSTESIAHGS